MTGRTLVYGPAYLDRVLRVGGPLQGGADRPPLDLSVDGRLAGPGEGLFLIDPAGARIEITPPPGWPGPFGTIRLGRALGAGAWNSRVAGRSWHDDLGGMGAGYAAALGATLFSALGPADDPMSRTVSDRLASEGIDHRPRRVPGRAADWTLLVTSAEHGDKLPVGFRGCHAALGDLPPAGDCDLLVVASLPNRLAAGLLTRAKARIRFFAPAVRNVADGEFPLSRFAHAIDVLSCNRREWECLADREAVAERLALRIVTDGAAGARIWHRDGGGRTEEVHCPAFPRRRPPRDTNRAGEAFASTLIAGLIGRGWGPGRPCRKTLLREEARRASAAAALVLDRPLFGFPGREEIDAALARGSVDASGDDAAADL